MQGMNNKIAYTSRAAWKVEKEEKNQEEGKFS